MPKGSNSVGVCAVRMVERQDTVAPPRPGPARRIPTPKWGAHPWLVLPAFPWVSGTSGFAVAENYLGHASPQAPDDLAIAKNRGCGWAYAGGQARHYRPSSSHFKSDANRPRSSAEVAQQSDQDRPVPLTRASVPGTLPSSKSFPRCHGGPSEARGPPPDSRRALWTGFWRSRWGGSRSPSWLPCSSDAASASPT